MMSCNHCHHFPCLINIESFVIVNLMEHVVYQYLILILACFYVVSWCQPRHRDKISSNDRHWIVVFGHSYVRRAQAAAPRNLGLHDRLVARISRGGGSVVISRDIYCLYNHLPQVEDFKPKVILVHSVDLYLPQHQLLNVLEQFFGTIIGHYQPAIFIISQLLLFPEQELMQEEVTWINLQSKQEMKQLDVRSVLGTMVRIVGSKQPSSVLFRSETPQHNWDAPIHVQYLCRSWTTLLSCVFRVEFCRQRINSNTNSFRMNTTRSPQKTVHHKYMSHLKSNYFTLLHLKK